MITDNIPAAQLIKRLEHRLLQAQYDDASLIQLDLSELEQLLEALQNHY